MEIRETQHGAVTIIRPIGALVEGEADALYQRTHGAITRSLGRLVLDCSYMPFVDSAGLEALVEISDVIENIGQTLRVAATNETLRETIQVTRLTEHFAFYESVPDAVRSFL